MLLYCLLQEHYAQYTGFYFVEAPWAAIAALSIVGLISTSFALLDFLPIFPVRLPSSGLSTGVLWGLSLGFCSVKTSLRDLY